MLLRYPLTFMMLKSDHNIYKKKVKKILKKLLWRPLAHYELDREIKLPSTKMMSEENFRILNFVICMLKCLLHFLFR